MSGSRLGRGRASRLVLLCCSAIVIIFLIFFYRSSNMEMTRLRELHIKCIKQQEALATQLEVIYEYKIQLEKTLSNEKSANAVVKEELQKKASKERSLRDKDIIEAMQRFNSLQQNYKLLQTEHLDLKDDCKKKEIIALEDSKRLESTLQNLRIQLKKAGDEKEKSMENLKTKFMQLLNHKEQLEESYNNLKEIIGSNNGTVEHLRKKVIQLQRELDNVKNSAHFPIDSINSENLQILSFDTNKFNNFNSNTQNNKFQDLKNNQVHIIRPSSQLPASVSNSIAVNKFSSPTKIQSLLEYSSRSSSYSKLLNTKTLNKIKLPLGVPPIPKLIEDKLNFESERIQKNQLQESIGHAPSIKFEIDVVKSKKLMFGKGVKLKESPKRLINENAVLRNIGENFLDKHEVKSRYKLKPGVQEIGDPHQIKKSGFDNEAANEDIEQYDDYNYREPLNKNNDLHIEEEEDEREDADDYIHNNMNVVKNE